MCLHCASVIYCPCNQGVIRASTTSFEDSHEMTRTKIMKMSYVNIGDLWLTQSCRGFCTVTLSRMHTLLAWSIASFSRILANNISLHNQIKKIKHLTIITATTRKCLIKAWYRNLTGNRWDGILEQNVSVSSYAVSPSQDRSLFIKSAVLRIDAWNVACS